jgi:hypothetical protein
MKNFIQFGKLSVLAAGAAILATGCQTYTQQTKSADDNWRQGNPTESANTFTEKAKKAASKDAVIYRLEQGAALRAAGQYRESIAAFDAAEEKINVYDEQAKVSISSETGALLSNQANLPYKGRDYDKVMLNTYKALDYLQLGEPDKARVEFFRAAQRQRDAEENNKRRIEKAEKDFENLKDSRDENGKPVKGAAQGKEMADKANADPQFKQKVATEYGYLDEFPAKAVYVNPFVYYISGVYFLTSNGGQSDLSRARDAFRFTLGSIGENKFIKQDLEMVDQALQGTPIPPTTYVVFETGCAPERDQIKIPIPLFLAGVQEVPYVGAAFPTLKKQGGQLPSLSITAAGTNETTVLLASMDRAVGQDFKNELPTIITKTLISAGVKAAASYGINKSMEKQDVWTRLLIKTVLIITQLMVDIADTRTWNTLPKEFQFCRIPTPADHKIELSGPNGEAKTVITMGAGAVNLIYVKSINAASPLLVSQIDLNNAPVHTTDDIPFPGPAPVESASPTNSAEPVLVSTSPTNSPSAPEVVPAVVSAREITPAPTPQEPAAASPDKPVANAGSIANPPVNPEVERLCAELESGNAKQIISALKRLRIMNAPEAVPRILPCLNAQNNANVIRDACRTLAVLGSKAVIPQIQPLLNHPRADVRKDAQNAIYKLQAKG